jgi:regulator of sirC expression with transglutaminase-like and TPR domain
MTMSTGDLASRVDAVIAAIDTGAPVAEQALLVSAVLQPELDIAAQLTLLDRLAEQCSAPTREAVFQHLFGSGRFVGDRDTYHAWRNSCLDQVLATGRGMPITLSVLAIGVAARLGVTLVGVGMPGHFLVGDASDPAWFGDPFHARWALTRDDCRLVYESVGGDRWSPEFVRPIGDRLIVVRILNNLRSSCERHRDPLRLAVVMAICGRLPELAADQATVRRAMAILN